MTDLIGINGRVGGSEVMVGGGDDFDVVLSHGRTTLIGGIGGVQRVQNAGISIAK